MSTQQENEQLKQEGEEPKEANPKDVAAAAAQKAKEGEAVAVLANAEESGEGEVPVAESAEEKIEGQLNDNLHQYDGLEALKNKLSSADYQDRKTGLINERAHLQEELVRAKASTPQGKQDVKQYGRLVKAEDRIRELDIIDRDSRDLTDEERVERSHLDDEVYELQKELDIATDSTISLRGVSGDERGREIYRAEKLRINERRRMLQRLTQLVESSV